MVDVNVFRNILTFSAHYNMLTLQNISFVVSIVLIRKWMSRKVFFLVKTSLKYAVDVNTIS